MRHRVGKVPTSNGGEADGGTMKGKSLISLRLIGALATILVSAAFVATVWVSISITSPPSAEDPPAGDSDDRGSTSGNVGRPRRPDAVGGRSRSRSASLGPTTAAVRRYHELQQQITAEASRTKHSSETAYNRATVVTAASWFEPRKICHETCCAETVAISLEQDATQIINTLDGLDLADVIFQMYRNPPHLKVHANVFDKRILPCLQPGTIFHLDNHGKILRYFFNVIRPNITVPFVLMTTESDADSPFILGERMKTDDLLLKWYGTNPNVQPGRHAKFVPFPLGLSKHHPQARYLSRYLAHTNYTNPFADKRRWTSRLPDLNTGDLFVKFGINAQSKRRQVIKTAVCRGQTSKDGISCGIRHADPSEIYAAASKYLFGISPPGAGYDCYRTYELLLLGVIPIVDSRPIVKELFKDLPVVVMSNMFDATDQARQNYLDHMKDYVDSDAFRDGAFDVGWKKLFLEYWRRKILRDALGRDKDIVRDEEGREYYQAWRYTPTNNDLCGQEDNCVRP